MKIQKWYQAANTFLRTRDEHRLIAARYGYAVEECVNLAIASGNPAMPGGYRVRLQVTHGNTRPDIVILKTNGTEVAWLDITNQSSKGHINNKSGNWQTGRNFIAELLYNDFDELQISVGDSSIASHAAARSIVRQAAVRERSIIYYMAKKSTQFFGSLCGASDAER